MLGRTRRCRFASWLVTLVAGALVCFLTGRQPILASETIASRADAIARALEISGFTSETRVPDAGGISAEYIPNYSDTSLPVGFPQARGAAAWRVVIPGISSRNHAQIRSADVEPFISDFEVLLDGQTGSLVKVQSIYVPEVEDGPTNLWPYQRLDPLVLRMPGSEVSISPDAPTATAYDILTSHAYISTDLVQQVELFYVNFTWVDTSLIPPLSPSDSTSVWYVISRYYTDNMKAVVGDPAIPTRRCQSDYKIIDFTTTRPRFSYSK